MKKLQSILFSILAVVAITACSSSDDDPAPKVLPHADFDFTVEEGTGNVTFTNTSTNATSYEWEFGDAAKGYSTEANPTYTYDVSGSYSVTLTAIDENMNIKDTVQTVDIDIVDPTPVIDVTIDGEYDDWADIPTRDDLNFRGDLLTEVKLATTKDAVYIYLRGDKSLFQQRNYIYLDMDNQATTGNTGLSSDLGYTVQDSKIPGDAVGFDVAKIEGGFYVWGLRPNDNIGWSWVEDATFITWESRVIGEEVFMEWKCDLKYATAQVLGNSVFSDDDLKDAEQFAKSVSAETVRLIVRYRAKDNTWADMDMFDPVTLELGGYIEAE